TIDVKVEELKNEFFPHLEITSLPAFYNKPEYIEVLSKSISEKIKNLDYEHLLFSYHGVPERHIYKTDITKIHCKIDGSCCVTPSHAHDFCYRQRCLKVTAIVAETLKLPPGASTTSLRSRSGFAPWLKPPPDRTVERLGLEGTKK